MGEAETMPLFADATAAMDAVDQLPASTPRVAPVVDVPAWALVVERVLDITVAAAVLVLLSPILLLVAVAVKATSRGPVLFRQTRVGRDGVPFRMWKFRSMVVDASERIAADPELRRIYEANNFKLPEGHSFQTPIGAFLRRTSLDEVPQLVQVLLGTMSLVGVRPIEPGELARRAPADQAAYTARRPGITGLWQVSGRSKLSYDDRCALDHEYVTRWSLRLDLWILLRTPFAVVRIFDTL